MTQPYPYPQPYPPVIAVRPEKSFMATFLLALLFGTFGADRFYLGKTGTGVLKLLTLGGYGLWSLIDLILVLVGAQNDIFGRALAGYEQHKQTAWKITAIVVAVWAVLFTLQAMADLFNQ